jgi:hypothetical protein
MFNLKDYKLLRIVPIIFLLAIACIILVAPKSKVAFAMEESSVVFSYATCEVLDSATLEYSEQVFDLENSSYKKNVTVYFQISNTSAELNYGFGIKSESNDEIVFMSNKVEEDIVSYKVTSTGVFLISCYLYENGITIDSVTVTVKSDLAPPDTYGLIKTMEEYQKVESVFNVTFDTLQFSDQLSGKKEVYYSFESSLPNETKSRQKAEDGINTFPITNNGVLYITYIDQAGNYANLEYYFDKYDNTPPPVPQILVVADSDTDFSGGYTKSYTVTIEYGKDNESGAATQNYYVINGETKPYNSPFKVASLSGITEKKTTIQARTVDKVGNASEFSEVKISDDTFDIYMPILKSVQFNLDLMKEKPYYISFVATDSISGVDNNKVYIEDTSTQVISGANNTFYAEFLPFGKSSLVIHVSDKVQNVAIHHMVINYFGETSLSKIVENYYDTYHSLNFSLYTQSVADSIKSEYDKLNIALMADNKQYSEFDAICRNIDKLILGSSNHVYVIESVPNYISSSLKYKISESDFTDYKKGDAVKLVLNAKTLDNEKTYVKLTDFSKGFAEAFNLSAYYKDEMLNNLASGIKIEMNLPYGFYERQFVIINKTTNEIVPTTIYNNQIAFSIKDSGDYVMVVSGEKLVENKIPKTIKVFGKAMPYSTFFGTIFGTLGGVIVIVGILIVMKKKRG